MVRSLQYAASAPAGSASAQGLPDREALRATEWMTTVYDNYALYDLDQDTRTELAVVRVDKAGTNSAVDLYGWRDGSFMVRPPHRCPWGSPAWKRTAWRPTSSRRTETCRSGLCTFQVSWLTDTM